MEFEGIQMVSLVIGVFSFLLTILALVTNQRARRVIAAVVTRITKRGEPRTSSEPAAKLAFLDGLEEISAFSIDIFPGVTTIGRDPMLSKVILNIPEISRRHCTIEYFSDEFRLRDESSTYGTFLNGVRLQPFSNVILKDLDEVVLGGRARFIFSVISENDEHPDDLDIIILEEHEPLLNELDEDDVDQTW